MISALDSVLASKSSRVHYLPLKFLKILGSFLDLGHVCLKSLAADRDLAHWCEMSSLSRGLTTRRCCHRECLSRISSVWYFLRAKICTRFKFEIVLVSYFTNLRCLNPCPSAEVLHTHRDIQWPVLPLRRHSLPLVSSVKMSRTLHSEQTKLWFGNHGFFLRDLLSSHSR